ncbi:hypothetical protein ANN_02969 [Periplaneta americana]|uniref:Uncharacterized protein n=1 Tax=Periplaneta americana TaxID=6978 RepID=A0ABQ8TZE8_PERAM|nr:hypothetical protein ANN_02969 [Periplaneta americana]
MEFQRDSPTRLTIARLRDKFEDELLRISIRTIPENHEHPPAPQEKEKSSKGFSNLLENLFGKRLLRQDFQNRVSIAF